MKKIKLFLYTLLMTLILIPSSVLAFTRLDTSTQNPVVGSVINIGVNMNYGPDKYVKEVHHIISYDNSYLAFEGIQWIPTVETYTTENGRVKIDKDSSTSFWSAGIVYYLKFRVIKEGQTTVQVEQNGNAYFHDGNLIPHEDRSSITIIGKTPSSSTKLKSLSVVGYSIYPAFSREKTDVKYSVTVPPEVSSIEVKVEKGDEKQTIEGAGVYELKYGPNNLKITVTAQNGDSYTYQLVATREDNRTGDVTLKELTITNTDLKYVKGQTEYSAVVSRSIDSVLITARTSDPKATLTGTGQKNLSIGENVYVLNVKSSAGNTEVYTIRIIRSNEEFQLKEKSSKLLSLNVSGLVMDLSNEKTLFLVGIPSNSNTVSISPVTESKTAKVAINGNENLTPGINKIEIVVTEPDDSETTYTLLVYKKLAAQEISDLNTATFEKDSIYQTATADAKITKEMIDKINEHNTTLYYDVVNMHSGLLYQIALKNNLTEELDMKLTRTSQNPLTYQSNIPEENEILLYLDGVYKDGNTIKIYSYDDSGKYTLVTDGIQVDKGYVTFTSNGGKYYVFTTSTLIKEDSVITKFLKKNSQLLIGIAGGIVVVSIVVSVVKNLSKKKDNNEPSY